MKTIIGILLVAVNLLASPARALEVPYSVPARPWDLTLGQHRAVVHVDAPSHAVQAHLPWRLQMQGMEGHNIVVVDVATGKQVRNVIRFSADRMSGDIGFQPATAPGDYYIYYLPLRPYGNLNDMSGYVPYHCDADAEWLRLQENDAWKNWPAAKVIEFQARTDFDRFDPMEIIASKEETNDLLARNREPLLVFPEDRRYPIRMQHDLPLRWIKTGSQLEFSGTAQANEYYAFQVGLFPPGRPANKITAAFTAFHSESGGEIPASALTCFNLGGIDPEGNAFSKTVNVPAGSVQPLWFGVDVARQQPPGDYTGSVTIAADGIAPQTITVRLKILAQVIKDRGDDEPWRHSRLRWLNSTAGSGDSVIPPYTSLVVSGSTIHCLGREVTLGNDGFPASIKAGNTEILAAAMRFTSADSGSLHFTKVTPGAVEWESGSCHGRMEPEGYLEYSITVKNPTAAVLEMPLVTTEVPYMMGAQRDGDLRPAEYDWKWGGPYNGFWIGGVRAGVHCRLLGASYAGPLLNLYHPAPPQSWSNGGKGGVSFHEDGSTVLVKAYTGERTASHGQEMTYRFSLLITPVKPIDTVAQFQTRYFQCNTVATPGGFDPEPSSEILAQGVNVVNVHHATIYNPYINYPYLKTDLLSQLTARMHRQGVKVKLYDTIRELSNMVTELWALRSLGGEIIAPGGGGGYAWCQEHMITGYQPAWFQRYSDGPPDAAFVTTPGQSRWYNYYIEGIDWLIRNADIDGLYLDDVAYDRHILKRVRTVMDHDKPGCLIDLHSNTGFSVGPANQYEEFFPYLNRLWFGESFNYNGMTPDQWMVEVSGIPFGVMGEMLYEGGNPWRGTLYGMTVRQGWETGGVHLDARPVWRIWDRFGIADPQTRMIGYWEPSCPVKTDNKDVLTTVYRRPGKALIALASWAPAKANVNLTIDWNQLGIDPGRAVLYAPRSAGFQKFQQWKPGESINVEPGHGWLIIVNETGPGPEDSIAQDDTLQGRPVLFKDDFHSALDANWKVYASKKPGTTIETRRGTLAIHAATNATAVADHPLPPGTTAVDCRVDRGNDSGETWGPGLAVYWPGGASLRICIRAPDGGFGIDSTACEQRNHQGRLGGPGPVTLRIRMDQNHVYAEALTADEDWQTIATLPRASFPGDPQLVRLGKMSLSNGLADYDGPAGVGAAGDCSYMLCRAYGK